MDLRIILCVFVVVVVPSAYSQCDFCADLEEFYEGIACKTNCRRGDCITGYDCRTPISKVGKECIYRNTSYNLRDKIFIQASPDTQLIFTCRNVSNLIRFVQTGFNEETGPFDPADLLIIEIFSSRISYDFALNFPVILSDENQVVNLSNDVLPPPTCIDNSVHCCRINDKKYAWNQAIVFDSVTYGNLRCTCRCSPFMECVSV